MQVGTSDLLGSPQIVQGAGKQVVGAIEFVCIPCYHDRVSGRERGSNTIFCFTVDGIRVCHCGDLGHPLDDATLQSLGRVGVLPIPTGGPPATLELGDAVTLWQKLKPDVTIPMHFRNEKCSFAKYGIDELLRVEPSAVCAAASEAEFTAGQLPRSQVFILEPAL